MSTNNARSFNVAATTSGVQCDPTASGAPQAATFNLWFQNKGTDTVRIRESTEAVTATSFTNPGTGATTPILVLEPGQRDRIPVRPGDYIDYLIVKRFWIESASGTQNVAVTVE